jgi:hypothetical protein
MPCMYVTAAISDGGLKWDEGVKQLYALNRCGLAMFGPAAELSFSCFQGKRPPCKLNNANFDGRKEIAE